MSVSHPPDQLNPNQPRITAPVVIGVLLLIVVIGVVFGPAIGHSFVAWDDQGEIYFNPDLNPVTWRGVMSNWTQTRLTVWMPLTYMVWGAIALVSHHSPDANGIALDPAPFHAACVAFHIIAAVMVFLTLRRLVGGAWPAVFGAAVFALHPLQVEPVAWASGMYTVLSGALAIAALFAYLKSIDAVTPLARWIHFSSATLLFIAAMLAKPSAMILPIIVAAIHTLLIRRQWRDVIWMLVIWVPLSAGDLYKARQFHSADVVPSLAVYQRLIVAGDAMIFYLRKLFAPIHLVPDYGRLPAKVLANHPGWWIGLICAGLVLLAILLSRRTPRLAASIAIFILGIAPFLGFVKFDYQFYSTVADRYAYLAMFGAALACAAFLACCPRPFKYGLLGAGILAMAILSFRQVQHWHDTQMLFKYTLTIRPDSLVAHRVLGTEEIRTDPEDAAKHFEAAIAARPDDPTAHKNYGDLLSSHGKISAAAEQYEFAARYNPKYFRAIYNLGVASLIMRDVDKAELCFRQSIDISDELKIPFAEGHEGLGEIFAAHGQDKEAIEQFELALQINPDLQKARRSLDRIKRN